MKKKTFGRVAAVGLAGLTMIPAFSIVASADVKPNSDGVLSGTAYLVEWSGMLTTTVMKPSYGTSLSFIRDSIAYDRFESGAATISYTSTDGTVTTSYTMPSEKKIYYGYNDAANLIKTSSATAVNDAEKANQADYAAWQNLWKDYYWLVANEETTTATVTPNCKIEFTPGTGAAASFKTSQGLKDTFALIDYDITVSVTNKTMKNLSDEVANKDGYVKMDNQGVITTATGNSGSGVYKLNTNSNGSANDNNNNGSTVYGKNVIPSGYRYASSNGYSYYSYLNDTWYPNAEAFRVAVGYSYVSGNTYGDSAKIASPAYSSSRHYFNPENGNYYTADEVANRYYAPYAVSVTGTSASGTENAIYRVKSTGLYYYTWSSAYAASGNDPDNITYINSYTSLGNYFSRRTGGFYSTYAAALSASGGNSAYVVTITATSDSYYDDPYYWYFMNSQGTNNSSNLGGASVKIGNKSGWSNVRTSINKASSGATLNVSLNGETTIPEAILTALNGKNVTVNFTLKNGSVITINGRDIKTPKDINVNVIYNTRNISSNLVKKATSINKSVSTSQVSISSNTFGGSASLTVKFNAKRAGYKAKIYRYNPSRNSLQLVDSSTISSSGKVKFDNLTQGGDFVIVICG